MMDRWKMALAVAVIAALGATACDNGPTDPTPTSKEFAVSARVVDADTGQPIPASTQIRIDFAVNGDSEQGVVVDGDGWTKIVQLRIIGDTNPQEVTLTIHGGVGYGTSKGLYPLTWEYNPRAGTHVQTAKVALRRVP